ncbi:TPA: transcriptional regulator [Escherichia coli]|nr:transcriptional regulator [Escherichia coli]
MGNDVFPFRGIPEKQFRILIELSSIRSEKIINALRDHLVRGESRRIVCERYNANQGYLSICLARLLRVYHLVSILKNYY